MASIYTKILIVSHNSRVMMMMMIWRCKKLGLLHQSPGRRIFRYTHAGKLHSGKPVSMRPTIWVARVHVNIIYINIYTALAYAHKQLIVVPE